MEKEKVIRFYLKKLIYVRSIMDIKQTMSKDYEPPKFEDRKENYNVLEEIKSIQKEKDLYKYDEIKLMHQEFAEHNPELFEKCVREKMTEDDIQNTICLLQLRERVKKGEISFEQASSMVSTIMARKYQPELLQKDGFGKPKKKPRASPSVSKKH